MKVIPDAADHVAHRRLRELHHVLAVTLLSQLEGLLEPILEKS